MFEIDSYCETLLIKYNKNKYINVVESDISGLIENHFNFNIKYIDLDESILGFTIFNNSYLLDKDLSNETVVINSNLNPAITRFTLAHECGHIIIRKMLQNNTYPIIYKTEYDLKKDLEAISNYIASSLLMPRKKFLFEYQKIFGIKKIITYKNKIVDNEDIKNINILAEKFACSFQATIYRLKQLNLLSSICKELYYLRKDFYYNEQ